MKNTKDYSDPDFWFLRGLENKYDFNHLDNYSRPKSVLFKDVDIGSIEEIRTTIVIPNDKDKEAKSLVPIAATYKHSESGCEYFFIDEEFRSTIFHTSVLDNLCYEYTTLNYAEFISIASHGNLVLALDFSNRKIFGWSSSKGYLSDIPNNIFSLGGNVELSKFSKLLVWSIGPSDLSDAKKEWCFLIWNKGQSNLYLAKSKLQKELELQFIEITLPLAKSLIGSLKIADIFFDEHSKNLFIADNGNNRIYRYDPQKLSQIKVVAGNGSGKIMFPDPILSGLLPPSSLLTYYLAPNDLSYITKQHIFRNVSKKTLTANQLLNYFLVIAVQGESDYNSQILTLSLDERSTIELLPLIGSANPSAEHSKSNLINEPLGKVDVIMPGANGALYFFQLNSSNCFCLKPLKWKEKAEGRIHIQKHKKLPNIS